MRRSGHDPARGPGAGDELGAHVSTAGGLELAPGRAAQLDARVLQVFTKQPSRWAERVVDDASAAAFAAAARRHRIRVLASHDSYLINLGTNDPVLFARSYASFRAELERCTTLGIGLVVTHPGHATGGDPDAALARNADAVARALDETGGSLSVLFETTAGSGRVLGARFEELAALIARMPASVRPRVGVCMDTCHVWAAGYDLRGDYDGVMQAFADVVGLERLRLFHLNDSLTALGSRRDRHAHIGRGALGHRTFRRLLTDSRFVRVPKVIETPKGDDAVAADRRNLRRLRSYRRVRGPRKKG